MRNFTDRFKTLCSIMNIPLDEMCYSSTRLEVFSSLPTTLAAGYMNIENNGHGLQESSIKKERVKKTKLKKTKVKSEETSMLSNEIRIEDGLDNSTSNSHSIKTELSDVKHSHKKDKSKKKKRKLKDLDQDEVEEGPSSSKKPTLALTTTTTVKKSDSPVAETPETAPFAKTETDMKNPDSQVDEQFSTPALSGVQESTSTSLCSRSP
ncbi:unnamed protein product [Ambrosiozyma monospora]|uniref:Unnamed protein product n=1 Tax=Ambrosiozyma monospora TaxID=43982 RepID=A0ACB5TR93_AMBMO|nr:unnamed protein product [Ambrosiozyma monospora]